MLQLMLLRVSLKLACFFLFSLLTQLSCVSPVLLLMFFITSVVHRSDYTYRGGYHYRFRPPGIAPPVVYPPFPLSPPVFYHRAPVPSLPYHHRFKGPGAPHTHRIYTGASPPVVYQPRQRFKGHLPSNLRGPCPTNPAPTLPSGPVAPLATVTPEVAPVETSAPGTLPVSTQSGFTTPASAVETGRT